MTDPTSGGTAVDTDSRPVGRDEVIEATIRAASELFAERNPSQVSVREIASRAGVSHALVHRYLGSKDDIFAAALKLDREQVGLGQPHAANHRNDARYRTTFHLKCQHEPSVIE